MIPDSLVETIRGAQRVCVLTGAGVSAESGVPTFREAQDSLWEDYDPLQLATPEGFQRDPALVWRWYAWRRGLAQEVEPNPGHYALAEFARRVPTLTLVTQNVDGLHQRAGSTDVLEFHGNIFVDRCFEKDCALEEDVLDGEPPMCPSCGGPIRPGVVWFGEAIPETVLERAFSAAAACDLYLSIGTSALVYPAAGLFGVAREAGAFTVEVNPNPTEQSAAFDAALAAKSGELLPELLDSLQRA